MPRPEYEYWIVPLAIHMNMNSNHMNMNITSNHMITIYDYENHKPGNQWWTSHTYITIISIHIYIIS